MPLDHPPTPPHRIAYLTAGAAGMFCGSCMHDNTLARALIGLGCDVQLLPLYTPIRTDEASVAQAEIFFGGINVYLQQRFSLFRYLPRWLDRLLDQRNGVVGATVTSASRLEPSQEDAVRSRLEEMTGRTIRLTAIVDPALIGGLSVRVGDQLIDASVRGRLERLRDQLVAGSR